MANYEKYVPAVDRRHFLRFSLGAGAGLAAYGMPHSVLAQEAKYQNSKPKGERKKSVICLWMGGGPTHIETFDPKMGNGPFKPINTSAPGLQFSEMLPKCAAQGKHFTILRSVATGEGSHERGTLMMHMGMTPIPGLDIPGIGTVISYENGRKDFPLPHYIAMQPPQLPQGSPFGDEYLPFPLRAGNNPIPNVRSPIGGGDRERDRAALLLAQNKDWDARRKQALVERVEKAYVKSEDVMTTPLLKAFNVGEEPGNVRSKYGSGRFGTNCLLARRLVEAGVSYIEIGLGGWDMHNGIENGCKGKLPQVDAGLGGLVEDLAERNLLDDVLVMWMGEFGRTPNINGTAGRDHWARGFSVAMAGGAIRRRGFAYGSTGPSGGACIKPISGRKLFATIYQAAGISDYARKTYYTEGRKIKYVTSATHVKEIF